MKKIIKFVKRYYKRLKKSIKRYSDRWTLYLYYNGLLVKKLKIDKNEAPDKNTYCITFRNKNIGKGKISIIARPITILKNDEKHKKTYWGIINETGVRPEE